MESETAIDLKLKCFQCGLPIEAGQMYTYTAGEPFHAAQTQCLVLVERERCAKIADTWANLYVYGEGHLSAKEVAAAIRSGK